MNKQVLFHTGSRYFKPRMIDVLCSIRLRENILQETRFEKIAYQFDFVNN